MNYREKILAVGSLYQDIEKKIQIFKEKTCLDCVPGCGDCCNRFEPYISLLEGLVIADWLLENSEELENFSFKQKNKSDILCPFYKVDSSYHCGIYSIRPFICRLFAFSGKIHEKGISYCPCLRMQKYYTKEIEIAHRYVSQGLLLPIYNEEYAKICKIDFLLATDLHPLTRSIEIALEETLSKKNGTEKSYDKSNDFTLFIRKKLEETTPPPDTPTPPKISA